MSDSRLVLSPEAREKIKPRFFAQQKEARETKAQECRIGSMLLTVCPSYTYSAYLFLTGACTNALVFIPIIAGVYAGKKLGKTFENCLSQENKDPTDEQLIKFENNRMRYG